MTLAVHKDHQSRGQAASLLLFTLHTAVAAAESIGSVDVITHPLDGGVRAFYAKYGFEELTFDPCRAMMVRMADLKKSGLGA